MLDKVFNNIEFKIKNSSLSRRDALKLMAMGTVLSNTTNLKAQEENNLELKGKIVIIGGGLAGMSCAAYLAKHSEKLDITIIEPNPYSVSYQPGNTLVAGGIYDKSDIIYDTKNFIPKGTKLIKDKAMAFDPENNNIVLSSNKVLSYDFLIVASGIKLDFAKIKGLEQIKELYSISSDNNMKKLFLDSGICSVYNSDLAQQTQKQIKDLLQRAKKGEKLKTIYTQPNTSIKSQGATKSIMYLLNSKAQDMGIKENIDFDFFTAHSSLMPIKVYDETLLEQFKQRNFKHHYNHNLVEINLKDKIAIFNKTWKEKGTYDEDLEKYSLIEKHEKIEVPFDLLHITPPMKVGDEIGKSALATESGFIPVDKETLQHITYKNIFALGDVANIPYGKTGGSVRKQYKVLCDNLMSLMQGKEMISIYDGYTVYPLISDIGKVMLCEFNWTNKASPTFPLDPTEERYLWWLVKVYLLKPLTMYGMLKGNA